MSKLVSIIIPTFGRGESLAFAIESVLKQTYKNIEIIVVDDNDDLNRISEIKTIIANFNNEVIKYAGDGINRGGGDARNYGFKVSSGNYITFLDDDDVYEASKIEEQLLHIDENNLDVSICDMNFYKNGKSKDISNCYSRVDSVSQFLLEGNCYTPMIMMRRDVFKCIAGFESTPRYQDHILMLKVFKYGFKVGRLPVKLFTHNYHDGDRVTFSSKSIDGYRLRQEFEKELIFNLNSGELACYNFNQYVMEMKISRYKGDNFECIKNCISALYIMRSFSSAYKLLRCCIRVIFFPKKLL